MSAWAIFWTILFVAVLILYSILVVVVAIGGFQDIKDMMRSLDQQHTDSDSSAND